MSATRITELPAATSLGANDLIVVVSDPSSLPATKKATVNTVANSIINNYNLLTTKSTDVINVISSNYVQIQHNANAEVSDSFTAGSTWIYVGESEIGLENYDTSATLKSGIYLESDGRVVVHGNLITRNFTVPANSSAQGVTGQMAWDANYVYVCVNTNTWKRAALSTW